MGVSTVAGLMLNSRAQYRAANRVSIQGSPLTVLESLNHEDSRKKRPMEFCLQLFVTTGLVWLNVARVVWRCQSACPVSSRKERHQSKATLYGHSAIKWISLQSAMELYLRRHHLCSSILTSVNCLGNVDSGAAHRSFVKRKTTHEFPRGFLFFLAATMGFGRANWLMDTKNNSCDIYHV